MAQHQIPQHEIPQHKIPQQGDPQHREPHDKGAQHSGVRFGEPQDEGTRTGLTRRGFIKGAAALSAAGALAGGALSACSSGSGGNTAGSGAQAAPPKTDIFAGVCRGNCAGGCFLNVHVRDNKVVRTTARDFPDPQWNRICAKGLTQVARTYSARRVQYPMRRVGERGEGKFERISWDEAINTIAQKFQGYAKDFGPASVSVMYGSGNYAVANGASIASGTDRFRNVLGASNININVDAARGKALTGMIGTTPLVTQNEATDYVNSKTLVCWGSNPTVSSLHVVHFIQEQRERGAKYVVIDPTYNANAAKADLFLPLNPSTDGALGFGVLSEIFAQGWQNTEFLKKSTEAGFLIKEDGKLLRMSDVGVEPTEGPVNAAGQPTKIDPQAVFDEVVGAVVPYTEATSPKLEGVGEVKGIKVKTELELVKEKVAEWSIERASQVSGVPVSQIKELARIYAQEGPVNTINNFGPDHYVNGHYNYWLIGAICLITGNIGCPGGGLGLFELLPVHCANMSTSVKPKNSAGELALGAGPVYPVAAVPSILDTGEYNGKPALLKAVYVINCNPMVTMAEWKKTEQWMKKIDFVVVAETSFTETAQYADILLPAAHWFEVSDLFACYSTHPYLVWQDKAIEPLFEAKSDFDIFKLIAGALGLTLEALKEKKAMRVLPGDIYRSYEGGVFSTPTKKGSFYFETPTVDYQLGQTVDLSKEHTVHWEPAAEADLSSPVRAKHAYSVLSDHMRTRTHSQWWDVEYMDDYEPDPLVRLNPLDAAELGLKEGDRARLYNDRGEVVLLATIHHGLPRKMVSCPRSFQAEEFIKGHFAALSSNTYNQICQNQAFNDVAVSIEKA